jgi:hypothetical protein
MNKFHSFTRPASFRAPVLALVAISAALAAGCANNPPRLEQAIANDHPDDWALRIGSLPVELHGTVPGETTTQTSAELDNATAKQAGAEVGNSGLSLYATPRVVVYVGGTEVPARDKYCAIEPEANRPVVSPESKVVLRSELCDGPRPVAYARVTIPATKPTAEQLAQGIDRAKSSLVQSLTPEEPMLQSRYWN